MNNAMVATESYSYESKNLLRLVDIARAMLDKPHSSFLHYSFLIDKTKIITIGWNNVSYSGVKINNKYYFYRLGGIHSESSALKKYRGDYTRLKMVNIRLNNKGELRMSKPCDTCRAIIKDCGIKKIIYSTNTGFILERV